MSFEDKVLGYLAELTQEMTSIKSELKDQIFDLRDTIVRIENEHGKKLDALFDGYEQNTRAIEKMQLLQEQNKKTIEKLCLGQGQHKEMTEQNTQAILELSKDVKKLDKKVTEQEIKLKLIK